MNEISVNAAATDVRSVLPHCVSSYEKSIFNTLTCIRCSKHSHTVILSVSYLSVDVIGMHAKKPQYTYHLTQRTLCYFLKSEPYVDRSATFIIPSHSLSH